MSRPTWTTTWGGQEAYHVSVPLPSYFSHRDIDLKISQSYLVAALHHEPRILVYSLRGALIHSLQVPSQSRLLSLDTYQDILVTLEEQSDPIGFKTISVWDLVSGERLQLCHGAGFLFSIVKPELVEVEKNGILTTEKSPEKPLIVTTSTRPHHPALRIWTLPSPGEGGLQGIDRRTINGNLLLPLDIVLQGPDDWIGCFAARGRNAITGSADCRVRVWDTMSGSCNWVFIGHTNTIMSVDLDRRQAYSGSRDTTVRVWDLQTGECSYILKSYPNIIRQVKISSSFLASHYFDGTLCVWDPNSGKLKCRLTGGLKTFQYDDRKVISGRLELIKLWDIHSGALLKDLPCDGLSVTVQKVSFRGKFCVAYSWHDNGEWLDIWEFGDADGYVEEGE